MPSAGTSAHFERLARGIGTAALGDIEIDPKSPSISSKFAVLSRVTRADPRLDVLDRRDQIMAR